MNKNVLVKDVDGEAWNRFTGICKIKGERVGEALTNLIKQVKYKER